jgi:Alr-MurF fusion protein
MTNIEQIKNWCAGKWQCCTDGSSNIATLETDSRGIGDGNGALFVALKTKVRNGHEFIAAAYSKGVRNFLVSESIDLEKFAGCNIVAVTDTLAALQRIAAEHRKTFQIPVIGITGSNGKTIVKEWLYHLLGAAFHIVRSPQSYNSQIGVPLSVWQMKAEHQLAIFEAGISQINEMAKLEAVIQPTIGIFTNIGEAHREGFDSDAQKIQEKLQLFNNCATIIFCNDNEPISKAIHALAEERVRKNPDDKVYLFSWSTKGAGVLSNVVIEKTATAVSISGLYKSVLHSVTIPFTDDASVSNAIHCWCVALLLQQPAEQTARLMATLQQVSMRLELMQGINNCTVINDSYNSDLTSVQIAINHLVQQKQHPRHTVILSDIPDMGNTDTERYARLAAMLQGKNIYRFIGIGEGLHNNRALFESLVHTKTDFYTSTQEFLKSFHLLHFEDEIILLKGARAFTFEKISVLLEQKVHQTVLYVNLAALRHNLNVYRSLLPQGVKTMAMVKAFGYGSGSYEIAQMLQQAGVDYVTVAYTDEGVELRKAGISLPIMVMNPEITSFPRMLAWNLEPEIYNFQSLGRFAAVAQALNVSNYPVHIKLDTGMHRLGFGAEDMTQLAGAVRSNVHLRVASIFSHLAAGEDATHDCFTALQADRFHKMSQILMQQLAYKPLLHICNTASVSRHPHLHHDMVRLGLGLYGIDSSRVLQDQLQQTGVLKTVIAQIRTVQKGESVGYGHNAVVENDTRVATVCIGYADGYRRNLGNGKAYMLIHGKQARTLGTICMDMCMTDVTDIPDAKEGDEVIVMGGAVPVAQLAVWAGTIPYEIMTGVSQRVKRVYLNE